MILFYTFHINYSIENKIVYFLCQLVLHISMVYIVSNKRKMYNYVIIFKVLVGTYRCRVCLIITAPFKNAAPRRGN